LVDRIVTGNLPEKEQLQLEEQLGYQDHLLITSEPFALWAIETNHKSTVNELCFAQVDPGVIIAPSIEKFRELKLRLLNGTHTFSCGVAILAGFETVKEAMLDSDFSKYINELLLFEIGPTLINNEITNDEVNAFADVVIDRFSNPNIAHFWKSIAMNYTEKMKMRNIPIIEKYISLGKKIPEGICFSFAVYCIYQESLFQIKVDVNEFSLNQTFQAEVKYWIQLIQQSGVKKIIHQFVKNKVTNQ
jgi:tagaturonate reductase